MKKYYFFLILVLTLFVSPVKSQTDKVDKWIPGTHTVGSSSLEYRLFVPENYDSTVKYPIVFAFGGINWGTGNYFAKFDNAASNISFADPVNQKKNPCIILMPGLPGGGIFWWDPKIEVPLKGLIASLEEKYSLDKNRYYITGFSLGGYETFLGLQYNIGMFAAAIPMSTNYGENSNIVKIFKDVPVWNFVGQTDEKYIVDNTRKTMEAYENLNSKVIYTKSKYNQKINLSDDQIKNHVSSHSNPFYTEYPGRGHEDALWTESYNTPMLQEWLFSKYKLKAGAIKLSVLNDLTVYPVLNESYSIKWNSDNSTDSVEIWFSNNDGDSWELLQSQISSGSFDWDISKVQDCSLGKIRILLKNSLGFVYGINESSLFAINNAASNGKPVVKILNQEFIKNPYISLASINLQLLIADAEKDSVTINLFISNDNGLTYGSFDTLKISTQMSTINRMVYLNTLCKGKSATSVIKAVISDNVSSAADSTISFTNSKGNFGLCPTLVEPDIQNSDIQIYPNPFNDDLSIQTNGNKEYSVELITLTGRTIYQSQIEGNSLRINLKGISSGIYFVRMKSNNSVSTRKVISQKK